MKPMFQAAKKAPKRIVFAEGEDERVLRAVQVVMDEGLARPILIGRPAVMAKRIERYGLRIRPGEDFEVINPESDPRYRDYWSEYYRLTQRKGISQYYAKIEMRRRQTLIGAMVIHRGDADGMLCGTFGTHGAAPALHRPGAGLAPGREELRGDERAWCCRSARCSSPTPTSTSIRRPRKSPKSRCWPPKEMRRFGITPKVALLSHSSFGSSDHPQAKKMQQALRRINELAPELEVEGEMHGDAALSEEVRLAAFPNSRLKGEANLLIMPTIDAANISFNLMKVSGGGNVTLGPILLGVSRPVHILTPSATVRRIVNMAALTTVDAQFEQEQRFKV